MKKFLLISILALGCFPAWCEADDADKARIRELEQKMAALESEKAKLSAAVNTQGLFDTKGKVSPRISNAVLIIEGDLSVGTGFIVAAGGKKYANTAAHVFSGNSKLTIRNASGTGFKKFGNLEGAEGADLVRLEILGEVKDFLELVPPDSLL